MKLSYRTQANAQAIAAIYNKPLDNKEWFQVIAAKNADEESEFSVALRERMQRAVETLDLARF